jgi:hypothetical protein
MNRSGQEHALGRLLLATTAVWALLLAYPIPGSQIYFGSMAILLAAIVCAADLIELAKERWAAESGSPWILPLRGIALLALLAALGSLYFEYVTVRTLYQGYKPLALPGTGFMRIEPHRGKVLRELAGAVSKADVALTTFRFNSLYLWSSAKMPAPGYLSLYPLAYSLPAEQERVKAGLRRAEHPVVVTRLPREGAKPQVGILAWIEENYQPYRTIGPYVLMKRRPELTTDAD